MSKKSKRPLSGKIRNPVAHHAYKANRSIVFQDRTQYRRTPKHKSSEPFAKLSSF